MQVVTKAAIDGLASTLTERGFIRLEDPSTLAILVARADEHCHDPSVELEVQAP